MARKKKEPKLFITNTVIRTTIVVDFHVQDADDYRNLMTTIKENNIYELTNDYSYDIESIKVKSELVQRQTPIAEVE